MVSHTSITLLRIITVLFAAHWQPNGVALVEWHQEQRGCIYIQHTTGEQAFIGCYAKPGSYFIEVGHPPVDGHVRPLPGDVFVLVQGSTVTRTSIRARNGVYLPLML